VSRGEQNIFAAISDTQSVALIRPAEQYIHAVRYLSAHSSSAPVSGWMGTVWPYIHASRQAVSSVE